MRLYHFLRICFWGVVFAPYMVNSQDKEFARAKSVEILTSASIDSQDASEPLGDLTIGDKCPDIELKDIINYDVPNTKLSDLKGKLIIFDFWTIFCSSCIAAMPKMEALQKKFGNKVQIFTVNGAKYISKEQLIRFWNKNKITKNLSLPCINDTTLYAYFKHNTIPHEVWVDGNGVVRAITSAEYVTEENITALLDGEEVNWEMKISNDFHPDKHLLENTSKSFRGPIYYRVLTGYFEGDEQARSPTNLVRDSSKGFSRSYHVNADILSLYIRTLTDFSDICFFPNRRIVETKDSSRFFYKKKYGYRDVWRSNNMYCYEAVLPLSTSEADFKQIMRQDLNQYLNLYGRVENRMIECLVMVYDKRNHKRDIPEEKRNGDEYIEHYTSIQDLIRELNRRELNPPIIDETNFKDEIDISFPEPEKMLDDLPRIQKLLHDKGFNLVKEKRNLRVFVITDR